MVEVLEITSQTRWTLYLTLIETPEARCRDPGACSAKVKKQKTNKQNNMCLGAKF